MSFADRFFAYSTGTFKPECVEGGSPRHILWENLVPSTLGHDEMSSNCQQQLVLAASAGDTNTVLPCINMVLQHGGFEDPRFNGLEFSPLVLAAARFGHRQLLEELLLTATWLQQSDACVLWEHLDALKAASQGGHHACVAALLGFAQIPRRRDVWSQEEGERAWAAGLLTAATHNSQSCVGVFLDHRATWCGEESAWAAAVRAAMAAGASSPGIREALLAAAGRVAECTLCTLLAACVRCHVAVANDALQALGGEDCVASAPICRCATPLLACSALVNVSAVLACVSGGEPLQAIVFCAATGAVRMADNPAPQAAELQQRLAPVVARGQGGRLQLASVALSGAVAEVCAMSAAKACGAAPLQALGGFASAYASAAAGASASSLRRHAAWLYMGPVLHQAADAGHGAAVVHALRALFSVSKGGGAGGDALLHSVQVALSKYSGEDNAELQQLRTEMLKQQEGSVQDTVMAAAHLQQLLLSCAAGEHQQAIAACSQLDQLRPEWRSPSAADEGCALNQAVAAACRAGLCGVLFVLLEGGGWMAPPLSSRLSVAAAEGGSMACWELLHTLVGANELPQSPRAGDAGGEEWSGPLVAASQHRDGVLFEAVARQLEALGQDLPVAVVTDCMLAACRHDAVQVLHVIMEGGAAPMVSRVPLAPADQNGRRQVMSVEQAFVAACAHGSIGCVQYLVQDCVSMGVLDMARFTQDHYAKSAVGHLGLQAAVKPGHTAVVHYLCAQTGARRCPISPQQGYDFGVVVEAEAAGHGQLAGYLRHQLALQTAVYNDMSPLHLANSASLLPFRRVLANPSSAQGLSSTAAQHAQDLNDTVTSLTPEVIKVLFAPGDFPLNPSALEHVLVAEQPDEELHVASLRAILGTGKAWRSRISQPQQAALAQVCMRGKRRILHAIAQELGHQALNWQHPPLRSVLEQAAAVYFALPRSGASVMQLLLGWAGNMAPSSDAWAGAVQRGRSLGKVQLSYELSRVANQIRYDPGHPEEEQVVDADCVQDEASAWALLESLPLDARSGSQQAAAVKARGLLLRAARGRELWTGNCMRQPRRKMVLWRAGQK